MCNHPGYNILMQNNNHPSPLAYLLPRFQDIFFLCILAVGALYGPKLFNLDGDLGRHITIGNYILTNKTIPTHDIFSHTMAGQTLVPHEWLAQILFSTAHTLMGLGGDVLLTILIIAITFTITYRELIVHNTFIIVALFTSLWAAMASSLHWLARPHIFTFLFLALWTYQLERIVEKKTNRLWFFPLLMLAWVNTHGAFIAGFVVWGAYAAEWIWELRQHRADKANGRALAIIGAASFAATFINPAGHLLWATSLGYIRNKYLVDHTAEYMSPNFHLTAAWPFLLMLAFFLFALGQGFKLKMREAFLLAGWCGMALISARNIPLFAIVTAPMLGRLIQTSAERLPFLARQDQNLRATESQLRGILFPVLGILLIAFTFTRDLRLDSAQLGNRYDPAVFPIEAVNWLEKNPQKGNMFNYFPWGGYLLYRTWPEYKVFIDGQTDFYGEALTREYEQVMFVLDGWEDVLEKYDVSWVIIPANSILADELTEQGWQELYRDATTMILKK